jgi:glyceraldehyde 3-phosphate dehydrogenase
MSVKLAINGFGRIGRLAFRRAYDVGGFEVVAINDLVDATTLAYLLKYDTTHRGWHQDEISSDVKKDEAGNIIENYLIFNGKKIPVLGQKDPKNLKWGDYKVDVVLECTGRFKGVADAMVHVENGAKGVIISAPSDKDTPTFVYGVNTNKLTKDMKVISGASCTTNCLAPVMKVLQEKYGVKGGFMTTVHAYTNDQTTLDLAKGNLRRGRAAAANIVPTTTGAAKAINLVIPELKGRLQGGAIRVPVIDGSLVDLSLLLNKPVADVKEINAAMKEASEKELKNVLGYTEDEIVSSDILGRTEGSIFDATQTMVYSDPEGTQYVKVVSWYDNEYSFTCQYVRLAGEYAKVLGCK